MQIPNALTSGSGAVWSLAFSPDGSRVAGGGQEGSLRIWTTEDRDKPLVLRGHQGSVWSVAFDPSGELLASAGDDDSLRIWNTTTGMELTAYRGHNASVEEVTFASGGQELITAHGDGTVRRWQCDACRPISWIRDQVHTRVTRELTAEERNAFITAAR